MTSVRVARNILPHAASLLRPSYGTASSAGIALVLPDGYEGRLRLDGALR
jgi:hypothetical protein